MRSLPAPASAIFLAQNSVTESGTLPKFLRTPPTIRGVLGMALDISLTRSQGFSRWFRTHQSMLIKAMKSSASKPTWSITGAMGSIIAVVIWPFHRLWWASRSVVSTKATWFISGCLQCLPLFPASPY